MGPLASHSPGGRHGLGELVEAEVPNFHGVVTHHEDVQSLRAAGTGQTGAAWGRVDGPGLQVAVRDSPTSARGNLSYPGEAPLDWNGARSVEVLHALCHLHQVWESCSFKGHALSGREECFSKVMEANGADNCGRLKVLLSNVTPWMPPLESEWRVPGTRMAKPYSLSGGLLGGFHSAGIVKAFPEGHELVVKRA